MRKLRGICVGAGYFSQFQYDAWNRIPEVEIIANANRSVDRAQKVASDYGIPISYPIDQFAEMLKSEKPDFVDIITPPETHLELCREALDQGIAVICQKPLAPTYEETVALVGLADRSNARFMVHENCRWQPWYRETKALLNADVIGNPYHLAIQCRLGDGWGDDAYLERQPFFREYERLFIFETGVHFLDTFRYLLGEVRSLYACTARRNPVIKGEDSALIVCNFVNGTTAILDANRYNESQAENPRYTFGTMRLEGTKGHLEVETDGSILTKPLGEAPSKHPYHPSTECFAGDCVYATQRHFVDAYLANTPFESGADNYLKSVQLVEAAYESAPSQQTVSIKHD